MALPALTGFYPGYFSCAWKGEVNLDTRLSSNTLCLVTMTSFFLLSHPSLPFSERNTKQQVFFPKTLEVCVCVCVCVCVRAVQAVAYCPISILGTRVHTKVPLGVREGDYIGVQYLVVKDGCSLTPRPHPVCDTETNPHWDWFGSGTETKMLILASFSVCLTATRPAIA